MDVRRLGDPAEFLKAASPLLLKDEARHNLILGIAGTLRDHPSHYPDYALWLAEDGSETVGAALRTPPHNLVLARPRDDSVLEALAAGGGDAAIAEARERTFVGTRRYVRRQRSWFRRDHRIRWLDGSDAGNVAAALDIVRHVS